MKEVVSQTILKLALIGAGVQLVLEGHTYIVVLALILYFWVVLNK